MNLTQIAKKAMYETVKQLFADNATIFTGFTRAVQEITHFNALNDTLDGFEGQQAEKTSGVTGSKNAIYDGLVKKTVRASRKALVYAKDQHDEELKALFDVQEEDFRVAYERGLTLIENIYAGLAAIGAALVPYRVIAADITAINTGINDFKDAEGKPGAARASTEAGTEGIDDTMHEIDDSLEILDDLVIHGLDDSNEDDVNFINKYRNGRKTTVLGKRHTGIEATFNDAVTGLGIENGTLTNVELNKGADTNILGVAAITTMKPGMYHFVFAAPGYVSQTMILKIDRGVTLQITVKLAKV